MPERPTGRCGYTWDSRHDTGESPVARHCCHRATLPDTDRCAWHAHPYETEQKTVRALRDALTDDRRGRSTGALLDGAVLRGLELRDRLLLSGCRLRGADLRETDLTDAMLAGADLSGADLSGAVLRAADLTDATLAGADLSGTTLTNASLDDADLSGADLTNATLSSADLWRVDLSEADLSEADLTDASLDDADLSMTTLSRADLRGARLAEADLRRVDLSDATLVEANLRGAKLGDARLQAADLSRADLSGAEMRAVRMQESSLTWANLREVDLSGADLRGADLSWADLSRALIPGAALTDATLRDCGLSAADLSGATLAMADLSRATLRDANLTGADLVEATLTGAAVSNADLTDADVSGATFTGATLTDASLPRETVAGTGLRGGAVTDSTGETGDTTRDESTPHLRERRPDRRRFAYAGSGVVLLALCWAGAVGAGVDNAATGLPVLLMAGSLSLGGLAVLYYVDRRLPVVLQEVSPLVYAPNEDESEFLLDTLETLYSVPLTPPVSPVERRRLRDWVALGGLSVLAGFALTLGATPLTVTLDPSVDSVMLSVYIAVTSLVLGVTGFGVLYRVGVILYSFGPRVDVSLRLDRFYTDDRLGLQPYGRFLLVNASLLFLLSVVPLLFVDITDPLLSVLLFAVLAILPTSLFVGGQLGFRREILRTKEECLSSLRDGHRSELSTIFATETREMRPETVTTTESLVQIRNEIQAIPNWPSDVSSVLTFVTVVLVPLLFEML